MNLYSSITPLFIAGAFYFVLNAIVTVAFAVIEKKLIIINKENSWLFLK